MRREVEPAQTRPVVLLGILIGSFLAVSIGLPIAFPKQDVVPEVTPKTPPVMRVPPNQPMLGTLTAADTTTFVGDVVILGTLTVIGEDDDGDEDCSSGCRSCGSNCLEPADRVSRRTQTRQ